ncbi:MAG: glycosyltransferase family 4 protein [Thermoplasmata archaeon]
MKVVFPLITYKFNSGIGHLTINLAKGLRRLGLDVSVVTLFFEDDFKTIKLFKQNNIDLIIVKNKPLNPSLNRVYQLFNPYFKLLSGYLNDNLINIDADFFIFQNEEALPLVKNNKFKDNFIFYHLGLWSGMALMVRQFKLFSPLIKIGRISTLPNHYIYAKYLRNVPYVISVSQYTSSISSLLYGRLADEIVYPPVDTDVFKPTSINNNSENFALYVGGELDKESKDLFSEIAKKINLVVVGNSNIKNAKICGFCKLYDLVKLYTNAKITLVPNFNEPYGYIPVESMSCGTPVVAYADGGFIETIENGKTGYLVKNKKDFLSKTLEEMHSTKIIDRTSIREHVLNNFSIDVQSKKLFMFLNNI